MNEHDPGGLATALRHSAELGYDEAWTMPADYYTDPRVLGLEREQLFYKEWICIGRAEELARAGDYMSFQLCDEPLLAVRGNDQKLRVFANVCRHRGTTIATGRGNSPLLICPYHHWSYDLEGRLKAAPRLEAHKSFDRKSCRLPEYPAQEWHGFLFTCLAPDPPALAPRLAPLAQRIGHYHMEQMKLCHLAEEVWHTNWKCLIENFMEGYHLTPLHRTTLHPVNPTSLCRHYEPGEAYFGYNAGYSPDLARPQPGHPDLTPAEAANAVMFAVPPGLVSGCGADWSSFICVQPESVDRVRAKMGLLFFGAEWPAHVIEDSIKLFHATMAEDKAVLAGLMRGLASRAYARGPLAGADFEGPVLDFYRYYHRRLAGVLASSS